jgi:hypothetical protein
MKLLFDENLSPKLARLTFRVSTESYLGEIGKLLNVGRGELVAPRVRRYQEILRGRLRFVSRLIITVQPNKSLDARSTGLCAPPGYGCKRTNGSNEPIE